jgi:hypothetical protein
MQRKKKNRKTKWTDLDLNQELSESIEEEESLAKRTFFYADGLLYFSIVGSIAATLVVSNAWLSKEWASVIAVIPALAIALERSFKWTARSDWHYRYFLRLLAIWRKIRDEKINQTDASRELTRLDLEMDQSFPQRDFSGESEHAPKGHK